MSFRATIIAATLLAFYVCGTSTKEAHAFELVPEFETLTEREQTGFEKPESLGPEYQSDVLTYLLPENWHYSWLSNPRTANFSAGSISPVHFMIQNRVKIHHDVAKPLEVRFTYFADRTRERDSSHAFLELAAWPTKKFGASIYVEPSLYKRENDVGVALLYRPQGTKNHEIRLFQTWVDLTRNKRSDTTDHFNKEKLPYARGLVGRWWKPLEMGPKDYIEYAIRHETRTSWEFPDQGFTQDFTRTVASLTLSRELNARTRLDVRAQADRKLEARSGSSPESWRGDRALVLARTTVSELGPGRIFTVTPGLMFAFRKWHSQSTELSQRHILPHVWVTTGAFGIGYEMTWYLQNGAQTLDHMHANGGSLEHRLNFSYDLKLSADASFRLLATFDADSLGTRDTWEGGAGQLHFVF